MQKPENELKLKEILKPFHIDIRDSNGDIKTLWQIAEELYEVTKEIELKEKINKMVSLKDFEEKEEVES